jgi:integrase
MGLSSHILISRALEFLILTVTRRDEVIGARWDEIDMGEKIWIVPAQRMKGGREHRVPLSARVIEILEATKTDSAFVFGGGHRQLGARQCSDCCVAYGKVRQRKGLSNAS